MSNNRQKPLCFTCKHGLCNRQNGVIHTEARKNGPPKDPEPWKGESEEEPITHIELDEYFTICMFNHSQHGFTSEVMCVTECNRYEDIGMSQKLKKESK